MKEKKRPKVFMEAPISPFFIADSIAKHSAKKEIGAHSIFLGQVRNDMIDNKEIVAIEYSAYAELAEEILYQIREETFEKFGLTCAHIHHSLGKVPSGEICLFVFTSAPRRQAAIDACAYIVERLKQSAPIWGKELFEDGGYVWKENT